MVNVGERETAAAAALPPLVRPRVSIRRCEWREDFVGIVYHCGCSNLIHVQVYRSGQVFKFAKPVNDSVEKRYPTVKVTWDEGRVEIESTCDCKGGCRFTREEGGSGRLQAIA